MILNISKEFSFPVDVVTQKLAWMGRTGAGKTYGFLKLAEEMLSAGIQVIILDPVGVHWGLRLSADGKSEGIKSIYVFGGLHADIPLQTSSGKIVADFLADNHTSAIIDVSQFESDSEKTKFATDFADRFFFRWKSKPSPVHIALEECQEFVPQNMMKGEERMLHAFNRMWKLGRNFGIGGSLISQRPQEVNKKSLNMTECFFAFQMTGPQERKAIEIWMQEKGVELTIASDLPKLEVGTAHIWSPQWLKVSQKIKISERWTYDASSTPKFGAKPVEVKPLSQLELDKLTNELKQSIEKAKESDPVALKKEISRLKNELAAVQKKQPITDLAQVTKLKDENQKLKVSFTEADKERRAMHTSIMKAMKLFVEYTEKIEGKVNIQIVEPRKYEEEYIRQVRKPAVKQNQYQNKPLSNGDDEIKLGRCAFAVLKFISVRPDKYFSYAQIGGMTGYSPSGGGFSNSVSELSTKGLIEKDGRNLKLSEAGAEYLSTQNIIAGEGDYSPEIWLNKLPTASKKIYEVLLNHPGQEFPKEELAELTGYSVSGSFDNAISKLCVLELAKRNRGSIKLNEELENY
jgi:hypothetical protein